MMMIEEEVYVCQPSGFEDPDYPDKVYKVEKALYGLHQALRAWYETLAKYLLDNVFHRGKIDQTLFIKRQKEDILLVQVYVDDIIFGSTKKELCTNFEKSDIIFISHDKYVDEILRKFKYEDVKPASTLMDKEKALLKDSDGDDVDVHLYKSMIGSLMYLTSSRLDIMFACKKKTVVATFTTEAEYVAAASFCGQVFWIQNQLLDYEYNFITLIELYPSHQSLMENLEFCDKHNMVAFLKKPQGSEDFHQIMDFLNASHIRYALTENPTIYVSLINQFWRTASVRALDNGEIELNATVDGQDKTITEASVRRHLKLEDTNGISTLPTTKFFEQLALMGTEQGSGNISNTQTKATPSGLSSLRASSEGGPECHFTMGDSPIQTRPERIPNLPNEPPLGEDENVNLVKSSEQGEAHETAEHRIDLSTASPQTDDDETLVETLLNIKRSASKDKEKAIMQESESLKKIKKKEMMINDLILWGDIEIMYEPDSDDEVWKNHQSQELIEWKLYDSCGFHSLMLEEVSIHMLVEKKYRLPHDTLRKMLQWKLHVNYNVTEMEYKLLRLSGFNLISKVFGRILSVQKI
nr:hypothetical protein [Tanacetum cinerariifolium]